MTMTIDKAKKRIEGEATLWWYEEIEVYGEGGESHHSQRYACVVKLTQGTIFGDIDEDGYINATISGFSYSDLGFPDTGQSTGEISSLCMEKIKRKPVNFIFKGRYREDREEANGSVLPNGWEWYAAH